MDVKILGSTKPTFELTKEEAINFSGKSAGICYMPDTIDVLFNEPEEKTLKRAQRTLKSGHHSVFDHVIYNLVLVDVPKIIAIILNNEKMYNTSEKSARYTKMKIEGKEEELYLKWLDIYQYMIKEEYKETIPEKQVLKLAMENARYVISIFTPSTTFEHTISLRQLNYIANFFKNYIENEENTEFNKLLKPYMQEFINKISNLLVPDLNANSKNRKISLFDERVSRKEEFGENYLAEYLASFAELAQAQRHRTLDYKIRFLDENRFFVPKIIRDTKYEKEWIEDLKSIENKFPQGMLVKIRERGTVENFVLKCKERLCGAAQLEIMEVTKNTLDKYIEMTKDTNEEVNEYLKNYEVGVRCRFKDFRCTSPCIWGPNKALNRKI